MEKKTRKSFLQLPGVQTILASLLCIMLGLLVGFVVLLLINHTVNPDTGTLYAWEAIVVIVQNFWKYNSEAAQMKYLGNTLVKTAPLLMRWHGTCRGMCVCWRRRWPVRCWRVSPVR